MLTNRLRELLKSPGPAFGIWAYLTDAAVIELMGAAGIDYVGIETEHGNYNLETIRNHMRAASASNIGTLVRTSSRDRSLVLQLLDMGAEGILFSHIEGAEEAATMVAACRYAPVGNRGVSNGRPAQRYGANGIEGGIRGFQKWANENVVVGVMIESRSAYDDIEEIAKIPGLTFVQVGASDLAVSLGHAGEVSHPALRSAFERIQTVCREAQVFLGYTVDHPSYPVPLSELRELGYKLLIAGKDTDLLMRALASRAAVVNAVQTGA